MLLEYLFYGEAVTAHLLYHNNSIFRSVGKAINECSIYQKPLRERKGISRGRIPLDYLDAIMKVEESWPENQCASKEKFLARLEKFPDGFFVAEFRGQDL